MKTVSLLIVMFLLLPGTGMGYSVAPAVPAEERTWTAHSGSVFSGRLKERTDEKVILVNAGGREVVVGLDQLSNDDRRYLLDLARQERRMILDFYRGGEFSSNDRPERAEIRGVPHVVQRENYCVPASAEMVLRYYGFDHDQDFLAGIASRNSARGGGTNAGHLRRALRNLGIESVGLRFDRDDPVSVQNAMDGMRMAIAEGRPVLCSYQTSGLGHMVVAIRYDDRRRAFWVLDPNKRSSPWRLDYKVLERVLTGAIVLFPEPVEEAESVTEGLVREVWTALRFTAPANAAAVTARLNAQGLDVRWRDMNRADLASSQGQTRSFARQHGVDFVRMSLNRGLTLLAPQQFDEGAGWILVHGTKDNDFEAVNFLPDGQVRREIVRQLDFSLRWLWPDERRYLLPIVEIAANDLPVPDADASLPAAAMPVEVGLESPGPPADTRVWTDNQGRQVTAKFVYADEEAVILERDGRQFRWPLNQLGESDREFVREALPLTLPPMDLGGGVVMEFVWIEELGAWIGKYEVTNEEFRRFRPEHDTGYVNANNRRFDLNHDRQPVANVSYEDAVAFAEWLNEVTPLRGSGKGARLLTGDEWTAIARCGIEREFPWGDSWPPTRGNYCDLTAREELSFRWGMQEYRDGFGVAAPVEKSGRNEWNLYGVGGNTFEWTSELRGTKRVLRGGNWGTSNRNLYLRIESRIERDPSERERAWGFRLAVSAE